MICPQCGTSVPENSSFCSTCGRTLAVVTAPGMANAAVTGPPRTSGKAIASLVLGIAPLSVLSSIPAVVFGHLALSEIKRSGGRLQGRGMAIAGLILGYLGVAAIPIIGIIAAIAIPNLMRARIVRGEKEARWHLTEIAYAQSHYRSLFPKIGYAPDLVSLGPDGYHYCAGPTPDRGCQLDYSLSLASAPPGKNGYLYATGRTSDGHGYFASAVPLHPAAGLHSYCCMEDGELRVGAAVARIADRNACGALPPTNRIQSE